ILVTKGRYTFSSLSKEYDREAVDPIEHIIRRPKDLDVSKLDFAYYMRNDSKYTTPLAAAPFEIGYYKFTLTTQTGHSEFFEDCDEWPRHEKDNSVADFRISPRSLIIKVLDDIAPYDEKQYDGYPWSKSYIAATEPSLNLLPGDSLTGSFMTRSAEIGVYDGSNSADFVTSGAPWKINNSTLGEQTSNYTLVFDGVYKILPRNLDWDVEGVDKEYDGKYYTVNVTVREPLYGYTIYCSEKELPLDSSEWSLFPSLFYTEPGTHTIYVKLVAPHYQSEYKSAVVTIHGKEILWDVDDDTASYDGYPHKLTTASVQEPWHATIEYAVIPNDYKDSDLENLVLSTTCPSFVEPGTYTYYVQVSAQNYEPDYRIVTLEIDNNGPKQNISITGETVVYDGKYHGPIFDFSYANVDPSDIEISYYVGDNTVVNPQWITVTLDEREDGTYYIPLYVNACPITGGNVTPYTVTVRTLAKGYGISSATVNIIISPLEFNLGVVPYSKVFDNKYHTLLLKGTNPNHRLEIVSDLEETTPVLKYRYYFDTDPESSNFVDLDVRYSELPPMGGNTAGYLPTILRYKDVGQYQVFIYVQAPNCKPVFLSGEVNILFNNNPLVEFDPNPFDVEYLAKPIELKDMPFKTVHDGNPVLEYRFYKRDGDTWKGDGISFNSDISKNTIAAPQDLGEYQLEITYFETRNCAEVTKKVNFRIVPRRLIIEYDKELEYTGEEMLPKVTAITNTSDTVNIRPEAVGGIKPKDIGDYEMDIYIQRDSIYQEVNENYFIHPDDQRLPFSIIARNIYVTITDKMIYDAGNKWTKDTGWEVENILPNDDFRMTLETSRGQAATYGTIGYMTYNNGNYKDNLVLSGTTTTVFAYDVVVKDLEILQEVEGVWVDAPYYKVNLGAFITIAYPDFDVEVDSPTFDYDGKDHSFTPTVSSKAINYWSLFWLISPEDYDTK
ncbi:MAG: hypothetical protein K2K15_03625, partial [Anaeroplasmataceae bacterium]|nr:hypothetical protein [Anaeroplasmataceae bacterium]